MHSPVAISISTVSNSDTSDTRQPVEYKNSTRARSRSSVHDFLINSNSTAEYELGHALLHRKENCYFIRNKTLLLNSKKEIEANKFAMELLLPDSFFAEYREFTIEQISRMTGYHQKLIQLRVDLNRSEIPNS